MIRTQSRRSKCDASDSLNPAVEVYLSALETSDGNQRGSAPMCLQDQRPSVSSGGWHMGAGVRCSLLIVLAPHVQVACENALLVRVLLDGIGAVARCVGRRMNEPGTLLRLVLLPTVERLGERRPHGSVQTLSCFSCDIAHWLKILYVHWQERRKNSLVPLMPLPLHAVVFALLCGGRPCFQFKHIQDSLA